MKLAKILVAALALLWTATSYTHPLAPALLQLNEADNGVVSVLWKTPVKAAPGSAVAPQLPVECKQTTAERTTVEATARVSRWQMQCPNVGLIGLTVSINNIATSKASAVLRVVLNDKRQYNKILSASANSFVVPAKQTAMQVFVDYLLFGADHLAGGWDHLLFVVALTLLVGIGRQLIITITMFTVGHSITLSLAALGAISFPQTIAEIFIALSIVLALGAVIDNNEDSLLRRRSWLMAMLFGLLHGLGFASALGELGLPQEEVPAALLAFNIGIELAQLGLILLLLVVARLWAFTGMAWQGLARLLPLYALGGLAAFWFWQRLVGLFS